MAATFADVGTIASGTAVTTLTPVIQTHSVGDLLIAIVVVRVASATINTPSGWSQIDQTSRASLTSALFFRVATGADSNPVFTFSSAIAIAQIVRFTGADPAGVGTSSLTSSNGSGTTHTSLSFNSTAPNSLAVAFDSQNNATAETTAPAGWSIASDATGPVALTFAVWTKQLAGTGSASGAISVVETNASWIGIQVEVLAATAVSPIVAPRLRQYLRR